MAAMFRSSLEKRNMLIRYGQAGEGLGKAERGLGGGLTGFLNYFW